MKARTLAGALLLVAVFVVAWNLFVASPSTRATPGDAPRAERIEPVAPTALEPPSVAAPPPPAVVASAARRAPAPVAPPLVRPSGPDHAIVSGPVTYEKTELPARPHHAHEDARAHAALYADGLPAEPPRLPR